MLILILTKNIIIFSDNGLRFNEMMIPFCEVRTPSPPSSLTEIHVHQNDENDSETEMSKWFSGLNLPKPLNLSSIMGDLFNNQEWENFEEYLENASTNLNSTTIEQREEYLNIQTDEKDEEKEKSVVLFSFVTKRKRCYSDSSNNQLNSKRTKLSNEISQNSMIPENISSNNFIIDNDLTPSIPFLINDSQSDISMKKQINSKRRNISSNSFENPISKRKHLENGNISDETRSYTPEIRNMEIEILITSNNSNDDINQETGSKDYYGSVDEFGNYNPLTPEYIYISDEDESMNKSNTPSELIEELYFGKSSNDGNYRSIDSQSSNNDEDCTETSESWFKKLNGMTRWEYLNWNFRHISGNSSDLEHDFQLRMGVTSSEYFTRSMKKRINFGNKIDDRTFTIHEETINDTTYDSI